MKKIFRICLYACLMLLAGWGMHHLWYYRAVEINLTLENAETTPDESMFVETSATYEATRCIPMLTCEPIFALGGGTSMNKSTYTETMVLQKVSSGKLAGTLYTPIRRSDIGLSKLQFLEFRIPEDQSQQRRTSHTFNVSFREGRVSRKQRGETSDSDDITYEHRPVLANEDGTAEFSDFPFIAGTYLKVATKNLRRLELKLDSSPIARVEPVGEPKEIGHNTYRATFVLHSSFNQSIPKQIPEEHLAFALGEIPDGTVEKAVSKTGKIRLSRLRDYQQSEDIPSDVEISEPTTFHTAGLVYWEVTLEVPKAMKNEFYLIVAPYYSSQNQQWVSPAATQIPRSSTSK